MFFQSAINVPPVSLWKFESVLCWHPFMHEWNDAD